MEVEPPGLADEVDGYREREKEGIKSDSTDFGLSTVMCLRRQGRAEEEWVGDEELRVLFVHVQCDMPGRYSTGEVWSLEFSRNGHLLPLGLEKSLKSSLRETATDLF